MRFRTIRSTLFLAGALCAAIPAQQAPDTAAAPAPLPLAKPLATAGGSGSTEASATTTRRTHNIGMAAGFVSGYGLSYRHWIEGSKAGFQVTIIPALKVNEDETMLNLSLGGMGLRSFHETRSTNFFGYAGAHYNAYYDEDHPDYPGFDGYTKGYWEQKRHLTYVGGGIGLEKYGWDRHVNLSIMFGYTAKAEWESTYQEYPGRASTPDDGKWITTFELQPSVEVGLFYSF